MANEIRTTISLSVAKSSLSLSKSLSKQITMTGTHYHSTTQDIATAYEIIVIPAELATLGVAVLVNTDATNYVEIGRDVAAAFVPVIRLKAGESAIFRFAPGFSYYAKANAGAVTLELMIIED